MNHIVPNDIADYRRAGVIEAGYGAATAIKGISSQVVFDNITANHRRRCRTVNRAAVIGRFVIPEDVIFD